MKFSKRSIRTVSFVVTAYIILAISWWAILLYREHTTLFETYEYIRSEDSSVSNRIDAIKMMDSDTFEALRNRRKLMIVSEALFIGLGVVIGLAVIRTGYRSLVETEKLKRNFLLAISHELKSPIAAAKLAFESILRFNKDNGPNKKLADQGLKETNRLHQLVDNVLLATKLGAGYAPTIDTTDMTRVVQQSITRQLRKSPNTEINFSTTDEPISAKIDKEAFRIVVDNLIDNAVKYSGDLGVININLVDLEDKMQLTISDNGPGIPAEERNKIFRRFYRIGDERTRKSKGSGLGLFLVHELIKYNKGSIRVTNNTPKGSIFQVDWPKK